MITINIIGAGRVGKTLAKLITIHGAGKIEGVCNTSWSSSVEAIRFIGQGTPCAEIKNLPAVDVTLITTPDNVIQNCCDELTVGNLKPRSIVMHCSGVLPSQILQSAKNRGCFLASVHPMRSFVDPDRSVLDYKGTFCAIEGDDEAKILLQRLFHQIGAITHVVSTEKKESYHVAGVFASNYLVTLFEKAFQGLRDAEINNETAIEIILTLMQSTLNNIKATRSALHSLTGPIKRGDVETIIKHVEAISDSKLYREIGLATLEIADLPEKTKKKIKDILTVD
ncbi:MAG TPA: Rossmann-like and DUF2520 domain-containing protein [Gammaproteobacteria bacterium]|nr:Rossmann-like and DUF2520 domain-containing protein [Gammaproteobacteria bacterium]